MDDKRRQENIDTAPVTPMMVDMGEDDQQMDALFARHLPQADLPPTLVARTQQAVLREVQRTYRPAPPPATVGALEQIRRWWRSLTPGQSLVMSGAVAAFGLLLLLGLTRFAPESQAALVKVSDGSALVLRDESNSFRTFHDGDLLKVDAGDHVISIEGSVLMAPFETQLAKLQPGSHLEVVALAEEFGATQVEYRIHRGALRSTIDEELDAGDRYTVHSPLLTVSATGTDFSVEAGSVAETRVTVFSGTVIVQMNDQIVEVTAGHYVDAVADSPLQVENSERTLNPGGDLLLFTPSAGAPLVVHGAPAADAEVIGVLEANTVLRIVQRDSSADWLLVCCVGDRTGWVNLAELMTAPAPP